MAKEDFRSNYILGFLIFFLALFIMVKFIDITGTVTSCVFYMALSIFSMGIAFMDAETILGTVPAFEFSLSSIFPVILVVGLFLLLSGTISAIEMPLPPFPEDLMAIGWVAPIIILILAPIGEELFFRGVVLNTVLEITEGIDINIPLLGRVASVESNKVFAIVVASFISAVTFALFHTYYTLSAYVGAFVFSIMACVLTVQEKSTTSAMISHILLNLVNYSVYMFVIIL